MANTIKIKRSAYNGTTAPADNQVVAGEFAIAQGSKKLYIGRENNSGGTVEAYHLPMLTDFSANSTSFTLAADSGSANNNGYTLSLNSNVAGDGLALSSHVLSVGVDGSSIETYNDALRVKASGITNDMLNGSIANGKLINSSITMSADSGTNDAVNLGETFTIAGTANEIETAVSGNQVQIGLPTNVTIAGTLTVNGATTTVNSTTVTIDDPIFTLGGDTAPGSDDGKDRGIEFRYFDSSAKVGFFGMDDSDSFRFKFIPDATNTSEVFSGSLGSSSWSDVTASTLTSATLGSCTIDAGTY